eukprot:GEMP01041102.1.p1 GENE.GEMP01041102.1~~GEMP01041102.1.p1  ORF type:complete len:259 (+),score=66.66 GEMP01041102.1:92-778(+)
MWWPKHGNELFKMPDPGSSVAKNESIMLQAKVLEVNQLGRKLAKKDEDFMKLQAALGGLQNRLNKMQASAVENEMLLVELREKLLTSEATEQRMIEERDAAQAEAKTTRVAMVEALAAEQLAAVAAQEAMHEYLVEQLGEMEKQYQVYSMGIEEEFNAQIQTLKENKQNIIAVEVRIQGRTTCGPHIPRTMSTLDKCSKRRITGSQSRAELICILVNVPFPQPLKHKK